MGISLNRNYADGFCETNAETVSFFNVSTYDDRQSCYDNAEEREKDFQATAEKDFEAYKQLLGEKKNVQLCLYANLNHAFVPSVYGNIMKAKQEYNVEQHIGEEVIADITTWIKEI